jgi:hypothetical protein
MSATSVDVHCIGQPCYCKLTAANVTSRRLSPTGAPLEKVMRTFLFIMGGLATLGGSLLVARWFGGTWRAPLAEVGKFSIQIWFCLPALNLLLGVKQAGAAGLNLWLKARVPQLISLFAVPSQSWRELATHQARFGGASRFSFDLSRRKIPQLRHAWDRCARERGAYRMACR